MSSYGGRGPMDGYGPGPVRLSGRNDLLGRYRAMDGRDPFDLWIQSEGA